VAPAGCVIAGAAKTASRSNTAAAAATRTATGTARACGAARSRWATPATAGAPAARSAAPPRPPSSTSSATCAPSSTPRITPKPGYAHYTVRQAAEDWLAHGLDGRSPKTITKNQNVLAPLLTVIGARKLRDLTAADVRQALAAMAAGYSTAAVSMGHLALKRAIRHAEAGGPVTRNVAALADTPRGQEGRPSESLTLDQAVAVMTAAATLPVMELRPGLKDVRRPAELMHAYIVLSLLCGLRTEEARALRWAHVDLDGDPATSPPVPPHVAVWRSVRAHGETKTERSRRTLALPAAAVHALRAWTGSQAAEQTAAREHWQDTGLVFTSHQGAALDAGKVRKMFKRIRAEAGAGDSWTPRELRTTFVSSMSHQGVAIEEIARTAGRATTRTTEIVYRRELRPVITTGAEIMDQLFSRS
jgi:integrase